MAKAKGINNAAEAKAGVEYWPPSRLVDYARNPRKNDHVVDRLAAAIKEFGFRVPILAKSDGLVVDGHLRLKAAKKLDLAEVPVMLADDMSEAQIKAFRISVNRMAELAEWDFELLAVELDELRDLDFDLSLLGFERQELNDLIGTPNEGPEGGLTDEDEAPPVPEDQVSVLGDVWVLGRHKIACGDSTDAAVVAALMGGEKAMLMQTDPPYGVDYNNAERVNPGVAKPRVAKPRVANDDLDGENLQAFLEAMIRAALPHLDKHAAFYLWHPMLTQGTFFAAAAAADILIHRQIIWAKPSLLLGRGDYHWQHELCFYGWIRGNRPPFYGPRNQTTLWPIGKETSKEHPTAKPVVLWKAPIENHTKEGELIYEPFSGSGSQIIAAEQSGRRCFALELAPAYVDVAVKRWQAFTGKQATLEATGETFDEVAAKRKVPEAA